MRMRRVERGQSRCVWRVREGGKFEGEEKRAGLERTRERGRGERGGVVRDGWMRVD